MQKTVKSGYDHFDPFYRNIKFGSNVSEYSIVQVYYHMGTRQVRGIPKNVLSDLLKLKECLS